MFSNISIQFVDYLNNLPKEAHEKILLFMYIILILLEILSFFYIRHITK